MSKIQYVESGDPIFGFPTLPSLTNNLLLYSFIDGICVCAQTKTSS